MARIRTVKPDFFKNEQLSELPVLSRLLFIGLWTQADKEGRLQDRPKRLKAEIFPYDSVDMDKELSRLQKSGFIERYEVGNLKVIFIPTFTKHQRITGSEASSISELPAPPQALEKQEVTEGSTLENFGNTLETPRTTGKEGKGREGNGMEDEVSEETIAPTQDEISFIKFQEWISEKAPTVGKMKEPFTYEQFLKLKEMCPTNTITDLCLRMHNWKDLVKKNNSAYLTFINWHNRGDTKK